VHQIWGYRLEDLCEHWSSISRVQSRENYNHHIWDRIGCVHASFVHDNWEFTRLVNSGRYSCYSGNNHSKTMFLLQMKLALFLL
jgi:hypothetical protein